MARLRLARTVAPLLAVALALAACDRSPEVSADPATAAALPDLPATLPLATGAVTDTPYAPGPSELPDVRAIPAVRTSNPADAYAYADQAYGFADALGDAPPDYAFDYGGVDPWAWQGYDNSLSFAEPIDGGYRYYYYRPGAETPYFIRDPRYGYGYDDGQLAVVYAADGTIVPYESYGPQLGYASRYWVRGRDLWRASRGSSRRAVIAANWAARRPIISDSRSRWFGVRQRQPGWVAYHAGAGAQQGRHWQPEQVRRAADTRRYDDWQRQDFRTPAPPRAIPARWQQAKWAQDARRFAPARAVVAREVDRREPAGGQRVGREILAGGPAAQPRVDRPVRGIARDGQIVPPRENAIRSRDQRRTERGVRDDRRRGLAARQAERRAMMRVETRPEPARATAPDLARSQQRAERQQARAMERQQQPRIAEPRQRPAIGQQSPDAGVRPSPIDRAPQREARAAERQAARAERQQVRRAERPQVQQPLARPAPASPRAQGGGGPRGGGGGRERGGPPGR